MTYVVTVSAGNSRRRFLVLAADTTEAMMTLYELNEKEKEVGEPIFTKFETVEPVQFEQGVFEL